jgi:cardiolipin-specific phospholipase
LLSTKTRIRKINTAVATTTTTVKMTTEQTMLEAELSPTSTLETPSSHRKSTSPSGAPLSKISPNLFPLSVSESFKHYWNNPTLKEVQHDLLSTLPFYPEPSENHSSEVLSFESPNSLVFPDMNEFHIKPKKDAENPKHLVIMHGYGAGLGFFIKNIESIAERHPDWHIHAIDLPGYGCSTRVKFPFKIPNENYQTVEKLFTVPLRDWFISRGLDEKNTITVAHSMGGYLSLLLQINEVNGTGFINEDEFNYLNSRFGCNPSKEKFEKQLKELSNTSENPKKFWDTLVLVSPGGIYHERAAEIEANTPKWFVKLWNRNISPFVLVRNTGPLGSYFVSGWTSTRFAISSLFNTDLYEKLHQYSYSIFNAKGSGEYMLNYLLAPGGIPRHPLVERIDQIKNYAGKTLWLYGGHDWMDPSGGILACEKLKKLGSTDSRVEIVPGAGHHIYLDSFKKFNDIISREMKSFELKKK